MSNAAVSACTVFPGDARACVARVDGRNPLDLAVMDKGVNYDGSAHHAPVGGKASAKLHHAVRSQKAEAWYPTLDGEAAGTSVEYASVLTLWNEAKREFVHYPAIYGEDTSVFADISKAFRERTKTPENPKGIGLGTWFEEERIRHWTHNAALESPFGLVPAARIGEYSPHSAAMIAIFKKLGARLGTEVIKEVDGRDVHPAWDVLPEPGKFYSPDGKLLDHIFPVYWSSDDGKHRICATFTEGISTFTGEPVIRVQFADNRNLPDQAILKDALASLLAAGQKKIDDDRKWGKNSPAIRAVSPLIKLGGPAKELQISAFSVTGDEIAQRRSQPEAAPVSLMRIHSFDERIIEALPGHPRWLGPHATRPVIVDFANIPQGVLGAAVPPARPLGVTESSSSLILH